jgi:hypothetical protein
MDTRLEQRQIDRGRAAPTQQQQQRQQATMRTSQAQINQDVAVALERVIGRLESLEKWRDERDDERRDDEKRRDAADDKRPELQRSDVLIIIAICTPVLYIIVQFIAQHWH